MQINKTQVVATNIANYVGLLISLIGFFFVFSDNKESYGFLQFLLSTAIMLVPLLNLGINNLSVRFFDQLGHRKHWKINFLGWLLLGQTFSFLALSVLFYAVRYHLYRFLEHLDFNVVLIEENLLIIFGLTFCYSTITLSSKFLTNYQHTVVPALFHTLANKLALLILVFCTTFYSLNNATIGKYYLIFFIIITTVISIYAWQKSIKKSENPPTPLQQNAPDWRELASYALYTNVSQIGSVLVYRIDILMVSLGLGVTATGIYTLLLFISNIIALPTSSITSLAGPIVAREWIGNNINRIERLYKSTSLTLTIVGIALTTILWFSLPVAFSLAKNGEDLMEFRYVFLLLGISQVWNLTTSINAQILAYTSLYKWNLYFMVVLAVVNTALNYVLMFVADLGLIGAALATMITMFFYNALKLILINWKLGIQPLTVKTIYVLGVALPIIFIPLALQFTFTSTYAPAVAAVILVVGYYAPVIYMLRIDEEFNKLVIGGLLRVKNISHWWHLK